MRVLCVHEMAWVGGAGNGGDYYCPHCDGPDEKPKESLGLPNNTFSNPPGWGDKIGGIVGTAVGTRIGMPTRGALVGGAIGHAVENFDWEWYRRYREIAAPIEQEYSGGLP